MVAVVLGERWEVCNNAQFRGRCVVLKPGATATAQELKAHCRAHLARFKVPHEFHFRDALPKGGTGKILKTELREPFWKGFEARVH